MRPTAKLLGHLGMLLAILVMVASDETRAQTSPSSGGLKATVAVRMTPSRQSERRGGASVSSDMVAGESKRMNVTAGHGNDLCVTGTWMSESGNLPPSFKAKIDEQEADSLYVWRLDVSMREVATDKIVFDVVWERTSRSTPSESIRRTERITLREGEPHTIDLVHSAQNNDCMRVMVDIVAYVTEDPELHGKTLDWDLWFSGPLTTPVHRTVTSPQGESAAFQFEPVATTITQPGGKVNSTMVHVYGQLRGRVRADGTIDVALTAHRLVNAGQNSARFPRWLSRPANSGQKNFIVSPGEAIKIVLPPINATPPVQFQTDPVTGQRTVTAAPRPAQSTGAPAANEMSITVQARVRE